MRKIDANSPTPNVTADGLERPHSSVPIRPRGAVPGLPTHGATTMPALRPRWTPSPQPGLTDSTVDSRHSPSAAVPIHGELLPAQRAALKTFPPPKGARYGGRVKGTPNKITRDVRAALRDLAEGNADEVQGWLDRVAETDPAEAMRLWLALLRFVTPVLQASAVANVTPKSQSQQLAAMSEDELLAIIHSAPVPPQRKPVAALSKPDPDDDEELLQ